MRAGQSLLVVAGVGIGLLRSRNLFPPVHYGRAIEQDFSFRLQCLSQEVLALGARTEALENAQAEFVSRAELDVALERAFEPLYKDLDRRFQHQADSVESLRVMVARTDELLDRVLENLEAMEHQAAA